MTNKLPVVGKRYKCIKGYHKGSEYFLEKAATIGTASGKIKYFLSDYPGFKYYFHESEREDITNENFWNYFEELPEDKAETKPETQDHELSPEVKEAMEELNKRIFWNNYRSSDFPNAKFDYERMCDETTKKAQNLLNALDKQFKINETSKSVDVKEKEVKENIKDIVCDPLGINLDELTKVIQNDLWNIANIKTQAEEAVSRKEENLRDEEVCFSEKESIWKPVSELPEYISSDLILRTDLGLIKFGRQINGRIEFEDQNNNNCPLLYTTLTDFINDYEKLKERVKKLEQL